MPTRNVCLRPEQDAFIAEVLDKGEYRNASKAMRDAIRALRARRKMDALKLERLRKSFDDGDICLTNNAAERALRDVAIGRKSWLFAGSERGGARAAMIYSLIMTAKLNGVDPHAWLADVLARIADHPAARLAELLPWHWTTTTAPT